MKKPTYDELVLANQLLEQNYINVVKAYNILMDYWDYFPEDGIREEVDKRLKEVGW